MGRNSKDNSLTRYEELIKISVRYNDFLRHQSFPLTLSLSSKKNHDFASSYVRRVKATLNMLNKEDKEIIMNEFFDRKNDSFWWRKYYSKSTYYRKRYFAVKSFLEKYYA